MHWSKCKTRPRHRYSTIIKVRMSADIPIPAQTLRFLHVEKSSLQSLVFDRTSEEEHDTAAFAKRHDNTSTPKLYCEFL